MQQTVAKSNASISLLLREKGDHAVVDEEFYLGIVRLLLQQPPTAIGGQCPRTRLAVCFVRTLSSMALCGYYSKISHGGSQGLIAVRGACEAS